MEVSKVILLLLLPTSAMSDGFEDRKCFAAPENQALFLAGFSRSHIPVEGRPPNSKRLTNLVDRIGSILIELPCHLSFSFGECLRPASCPSSGSG